jgi:epoxyqueuosine reductase
MSLSAQPQLDLHALKADLQQAAHNLGFADLKTTGIDLSAERAAYEQWLAQGYQGTMSYLARNLDKRFDPAQLVPGTQSIVSVRLDYLPNVQTRTLLDHPERAYIARYALGRDYHKLMRQRLKRLAVWLSDRIGPFGYRAFTDSAPVLERAIARNAGLGWIGKHTLVLNPQAGSWFFLGELYTDLELPPDPPMTEQHCGSCTRCLEVCPTQAFTQAWELDASKCISYLTIEHQGPIPVEFRAAIGNRIFGCDDCQIFCPFTKFTPHTQEPDFSPRHQLDEAAMLDLFMWDEAEFLARTEGMAIRRAGYENWQRNLAVGLGNGAAQPEVIAALEARRLTSTELVREHIDWALVQLQSKVSASSLRK